MAMACMVGVPNSVGFGSDLGSVHTCSGRGHVCKYAAQVGARPCGLSGAQYKPSASCAHVEAWPTSALMVRVAAQLQHTAPRVRVHAGYPLAGIMLNSGHHLHRAAHDRATRLGETSFAALSV